MGWSVQAPDAIRLLFDAIVPYLALAETIPLNPNHQQ